MKTFLTEKHNIPEGATHYANETDTDCFIWYREDTNEVMVNGYVINEWEGAGKDENLTDLKPIPQTKEVDWNGEGLPPVGEKVMCSYTDTDCDGWCDMHGPSDVIAYHGDYVWIAHHGKFNRVHELCNVEFEKPETPEQRKEREELKAAYDLYSCISKESLCRARTATFEEFNKGMMTSCREEYLAIVRKTGYRVEK